MNEFQYAPNISHWSSSVFFIWHNTTYDRVRRISIKTLPTTDNFSS